VYIGKKQNKNKQMKKFVIKSELSHEHWPFAETTDETVLDLGCGRHWTFDLKDTSPYYLGYRSKKIISIDSSETEIDYFNKCGLDSDKYIFICMKIESSDQILSLIKEYNPSFIKSDIEGYEGNFQNLTSEDVSNVKKMAIEYHSFDLKDLIMRKLNEWGFTIDTLASFGMVDAPHMGVIYAKK
jgi:hypothetical protein